MFKRTNKKLVSLTTLLLLLSNLFSVPISYAVDPQQVVVCSGPEGYVGKVAVTFSNIMEIPVGGTYTSSTEGAAIAVENVPGQPIVALTFNNTPAFGTFISHSSAFTNIMVGPTVNCGDEGGGGGTLDVTYVQIEGDNSTIKIGFDSCTVDEDSAETTTNYHVGPMNDITSAVLQEGGCSNTVTITTTNPITPGAEGTQLNIQNVIDTEADTETDADAYYYISDLSVTFTASVNPEDNTLVTVVFSEAVDNTTATSLTSYFVDTQYPSAITANSSTSYLLTFDDGVEVDDEVGLYYVLDANDVFVGLQFIAITLGEIVEEELVRGDELTLETPSAYTVTDADINTYHDLTGPTTGTYSITKTAGTATIAYSVFARDGEEGGPTGEALDTYNADTLCTLVSLTAENLYIVEVNPSTTGTYTLTLEAGDTCTEEEEVVEEEEEEEEEVVEEEVVQTSSGGGGGSRNSSKKTINITEPSHNSADEKEDETKPETDTSSNSTPSTLKDYFNDAVNQLVNANRTQAVKTLNKASVQITRAECVQFIMDGLNISISLNASPSGFNDIADAYSLYINNALEKGIIKGYNTSTFNPNEQINRAEFITIVLNALPNKEVSTNTKSPFTDVDNNAWYANSMNQAYAIGLLKGYGDGRVGPLDKITKEQAAIILAHALKI